MCDIDINQFSKLNLESILENVSIFTGYDLEVLKGKSQKREIVEARQAYFILSKQILGCTLSSIGKTVSKNHCTVLWGLKNEHLGSINHIVKSVKSMYYA